MARKRKKTKETYYYIPQKQPKIRIILREEKIVAANLSHINGISMRPH